MGYILKKSDDSSSIPKVEEESFDWSDIFDFIISEYHWTLDYIMDCLTINQVNLFIGAIIKRREREYKAVSEAKEKNKNIDDDVIIIDDPSQLMGMRRKKNGN